MAILNFLFGCWHENVTRIFANKQHCLDCGATRRYDLQRGIVGAWHKERPEPGQIFELKDSTHAISAEQLTPASGTLAPVARGRLWAKP